MSKNMYVQIKFKLNEWVKVEDWKKMSDHINSEFVWVDGFLFRDSAIDEKGNVYCIIKWENPEKQKTFRKELDKKIEENSEIMETFGKLVNMKTMTMDMLTVI